MLTKLVFPLLEFCQLRRRLTLLPALVSRFEESKAKEAAGAASSGAPSSTSASAAPPRSPGSPALKRAAPPPAVSAKRTPAGGARALSPADSDDAYDADTDTDEPAEAGEAAAAAGAGAREDGRPDTSSRDVPELPDFLRGRTFLLYGDAMSSEERRQAARAVTAFGGKLEQYFGDAVQYVITADAWDGNFDDAAADHPELMFVRPAWLEACAKRGKLAPLQPYLVTASSWVPF